MNRRSFVASLFGAATLDPERLRNLNINEEFDARNGIFTKWLTITRAGELVAHRGGVNGEYLRFASALDAAAFLSRSLPEHAVAPALAALRIFSTNPSHGGPVIGLDFCIDRQKVADYPSECEKQRQ